MSNKKDTFRLNSENNVVLSQSDIAKINVAKLRFLLRDIIEAVNNPQDSDVNVFTDSDLNTLNDAMTKAEYDVNNTGIVDAASESIIIAKKASPGTINPAEAVYATVGGVELVDNTFGTGIGIGVALDLIDDVTEGRILINGTINDINTSAFAPLDILFLSAVPGILSDTPPVAGEKNQIAGLVLESNVSTGSIAIRFSDIKNTDADFSIYNPGGNITITATNVQAALDQIEIALAGAGSSYYDYDADEGSTASAGAWTSKLVLNIANLPIGNYEWKWTAEVNCTTNNRRVQVKFEESASIMNEIEIEPKDANNWYAVGGFKNLPQVVAGPVTLEIFFKRSGNPATANCRRARISIKSV